MNENGLILKDKIINRISGPVSMYYLTPSLRELHNYKEENIDLPLIILFGDHHYSRENMCPNCDCDEKSCCYEIYHTDFLKELDKLKITLGGPPISHEYEQKCSILNFLSIIIQYF